jgi:hypothetical protein
MRSFSISVRTAVIIALAVPALVPAQEATIDYVKVRDTLITRTCGSKSLDETLANQAALERIDPGQIRKGLDLYHYDAAMLAYIRFGLTGDTLWLDRAILSYQHAAEANHGLYEAIQGEAICQYLRGDCPAAVSAVNRYMTIAPKRYRKDESLQQILSACRDE